MFLTNWQTDNPNGVHTTLQEMLLFVADFDIMQIMAILIIHCSPKVQVESVPARLYCECQRYSVLEEKARLVGCMHVSRTVTHEA